MQFIFRIIDSFNFENMGRVYILKNNRHMEIFKGDNLYDEHRNRFLVKAVEKLPYWHEQGEIIFNPFRVKLEPINALNPGGTVLIKQGIPSEKKDFNFSFCAVMPKILFSRDRL